MKKALCIIMAVILALGTLAACGETASSGKREIIFNGDKIKCVGGGSSAADSVVTIGATGEYTLSGTLSNGQVIVNTGDEAMDVTLILNGVSLCSENSPAIYVQQAKNVYIVLADGTENTIVSGSEATKSMFSDTSTGAAIYSEDDLKFSGSGALVIEGNINSGIVSKDDIDIDGGSISVTALNNGIKASESITVTDGSIAVKAGNDGMKVSSDAKEGKGFIRIDGGSISIESTGDGIYAVAQFIMNGGSCTVCAPDCIKVGVKDNGFGTGTGDLCISGGTLLLSADDDALKSRNTLTVTGGSVIAVSCSDKPGTFAECRQGTICTDLAVTAGETVTIADENGAVTSFTAEYSGKSVLYSSAEIVSGVKYTVSCGDASVVTAAY